MYNVCQNKKVLTTPFSPIPSCNQTLQNSTQWCPFSTFKLMPPILLLSAANLHPPCPRSWNTPPCLQLLQGYCICSSVCLNALPLTLVSTASLHSFSQTQGYILQDLVCLPCSRDGLVLSPSPPFPYFPNRLCLFFS